MYEKKAKISDFQYEALVRFSGLSKSTFCRKFGISSTRLNLCLSGKDGMLEKELLDIAEQLDDTFPFFAKNGDLKGFIATGPYCQRGGNNKKRGQQLKIYLGHGIRKTHIPVIPENKEALRVLNGKADFFGWLTGEEKEK